MSTHKELNLLQISAVREMTNIGLGHATTALSSITGRELEMSVPYVDSIGIGEIPQLLGGDESATVAVYMPIDGEIGGHIAFLMSWRSAQALWTMLLGQSPATLASLDELMLSAMLEIGNMINSSFMNAIADLTGLSMYATPPEISVEMASAITSTIVAEVSLNDGVALALHTEMKDAEGALEGFFLFIPSYDGLQKVFSALGILEAA